jgi:hypothetical protein
MVFFALNKLYIKNKKLWHPTYPRYQTWKKSWFFFCGLFLRIHYESQKQKKVTRKIMEFSTFKVF